MVTFAGLLVPATVTGTYMLVSLTNIHLGTTTCTPQLPSTTCHKASSAANAAAGAPINTAQHLIRSGAPPTIHAA